MQTSQEEVQIVDGEKLDMARDSVDVNANRKERESPQARINTDPHKRDRKCQRVTINIHP